MTLDELRGVIEVAVAPYATPLKVDTILLACRAYAGELTANDIQTERTANAAGI